MRGKSLELGVGVFVAFFRTSQPLNLSHNKEDLAALPIIIRVLLQMETLAKIPSPLFVYSIIAYTFKKEPYLIIVGLTFAHFSKR